MDLKEIKDIFSFNKLNTLPVEKGRVLISNPFHDDNYFHKAIILLCEKNQNGAFGLVLNNYIKPKLSDFVKEFYNVNCEKHKISIGGPVDNESIYYVHSRPDLIQNGVEISKNLFLGGEFESIIELIQKDEIATSEIKFFLGYSGWSEGQLESEMKKNSWFTANLSTKTIFTYSKKDIWKKTLEKMSEKHKIISNFPVKPEWN